MATVADAATNYPLSQLRNVAEYSLSGGKVVLGLQGQPPAWVEPTLKALGRLLQLPAKWNSYNSRVIEPACVWSAWAVLTAVMQDKSPIPAVVPTTHGGVQLEWHTAGIDLEFEIAGLQDFRLSVESADPREAIDTDNVRELSALAKWVERITENSGHK